MRPTMRVVAVKMAEQQAAVLLHRGRERLVCQRTGLMNALRGHLAEFGIIAPQGLRNVGRLIVIIRDEGDARLPSLARQVLQVLAVQIEQLEGAIAALVGIKAGRPRPRTQKIRRPTTQPSVAITAQSRRPHPPDARRSLLASAFSRR